MKPLLMIAVVVIFSACRREEEISHVRTPKEDEPAQIMPGAMNAKSAEAIPEPGEPLTRLRWTTPAGWKELPGNGIRVATLVPPGDAGLEASIVALPGDDVGQELPNVNRWRGQLGLPPVDKTSVLSSRTILKAPVGTVRLYDFTGPGTAKARMLAAIVNTPGTTWFFKMSGDAQNVGAARGSFIVLLEGLREAK